MAITSFPYFIFCFIVLLITTGLQKNNELKKTFLLIVSYYFYMTIDVRFAGLLVALTVVNFLAGHLISKNLNKHIKKLSLITSVCISLLILFYFKYFNFFIDAVYDLLSIIGLEGRSTVIEILLPVGISFMTFQAITYPIDLYKGTLKHRSSLKDFSLFMAFFPQLLSGPIMRASYFIPQLENSSRATKTDMLEGLGFILRGLIKKIMIADVLAVQIVDPAFSDPNLFSSPFLLFALFAYSFQVYMDLSGYTDIAIGVGKMLGYKIPVNFNRPYLATSIANFWQRWHITMSSFFRDYLYEAIKNCSWTNVYVNLWIVFIAIGIWHGAGWNFVIYGFIHGSLVGFEHFQRQRRENKGLPPKVYRGLQLAIRVMQIFTIVVFTRLLFRGDDLGSSIEYLSAMANSSISGFQVSWLAMAAFCGAIFLHFTPIQWRDGIMSLATKMPSIIYAGGIVLFAYLFIALGTDQASFIYFDF